MLLPRCSLLTLSGPNCTFPGSVSCCWISLHIKSQSFQILSFSNPGNNSTSSPKSLSWRFDLWFLEVGTPTDIIQYGANHADYLSCVCSATRRILVFYRPWKQAANSPYSRTLHQPDRLLSTVPGTTSPPPIICNGIHARAKSTGQAVIASPTSSVMETHSLPGFPGMAGSRWVVLIGTM